MAILVRSGRCSATPLWITLSAPPKGNRYDESSCPRN